MCQCNLSFHILDKIRNVTLIPEGDIKKSNRPTCQCQKNIIVLRNNRCDFHQAMTHRAVELLSKLIMGYLCCAWWNNCFVYALGGGSTCGG